MNLFEDGGKGSHQLFDQERTKLLIDIHACLRVFELKMQGADQLFES